MSALARDAALAAREIGDAEANSHIPLLLCADVASRTLQACSARTWRLAWQLARQSPPCAFAEELIARDVTNLARVVRAVESTAMALANATRGTSGVAGRLTEFVEAFLAVYDEPGRRRHGVYYTPQIVAEYLVARADAALAEHFPATRGLAGAGEIFDPAVGTGIFPLAAIDRIHASLVSQWRGEGEGEATLCERWDDYVRNWLLPRLCGCELMPAAQVVAQLLIGERLAAYGFRPQAGDRLRIEVADALLPLPLGESEGGGASNRPLQHTLTLALSHGEREQEQPIVVLGNPPYRGVSASEHAWVDDLLRGIPPLLPLPLGEDRGEGGCLLDGPPQHALTLTLPPRERGPKKVASYFHVDGEPLGEKKHWLHDDYVKFFRLAQWRIEQAGAGVVAFVTNHGYLDNPTFRGMRCGLLETFGEIEVIDLHGNVKHGAAERDESVFTTQQGMALSLLVADPAKRKPRIVRRADLRGPRREKLALLSKQHDAAIAFDELHPRAPMYFFHAESTSDISEYQQFWPIDELMPVSTTAIVTARDSLVIAFTREELVERLTRFRDLTIPDEQIRHELFPRSRTGKYPPGDTRGWKLRVAREHLAADDRWQERIRTCLYRPFDRRYIYWSPAMIDWPRRDVMRHMEAGDNLAIVCRRQQVRGAPCNFFWIADDLVIDGCIRSDNRGSESMFPLRLASALHLSQWNVGSCGDLDPQRLFAYIYAILHSPLYRVRFAEALTSHFPRVPPPPSPAVFDELAALGETLINSHLLHDRTLATSAVKLVGDANGVIAPGYPKCLGEAIALSPSARFEPISPAAWQFQVGAHQVLRKWLKDRRGRKLLPADIMHYASMVSSIERTLVLLPQIDETIHTHGGWPAAFDPQARRASKGSGW